MSPQDDVNRLPKLSSARKMPQPFFMLDGIFVAPNP